VTIDDVRYVVDAGRAKEMRRVLFPHWFSYDRVRVVNADP
jgi:HrpA-like RNA helicase